MTDPETSLSVPIQSPNGPFGTTGVKTAARCSCGAGPHPELDGRCAAGHVGRGNGLALVTGVNSATFWSEHDRARRELREAVIADAGHTPADAPRALAIAAESIAQSTLVRDSAYLRMVEAGGPLAASGRERRAFTVWCAAVDRLERHLRIVGLRRAPQPTPSLDDYLASRAAEQDREAARIASGLQGSLQREISSSSADELSHEATTVSTEEPAS